MLYNDLSHIVCNVIFEIIQLENSLNNNNNMCKYVIKNKKSNGIV